MKKFYLFLLALICSVTGWAKTEVTATTEMVDGTYITLQCMDTNGGDGYYFNGAAAKSSTLGYANFYKIVANDDASAFYLQRVSDSKYVANSSNAVAMVDATSDAAAFTFSIESATGWTTATEANLAKNGVNTVRFTTSGTYLNCQGASTTPKYATGTGGYSIWDVYTYTEDEVNAYKPLAISTVAELVNGHIYTFRSTRNAITWDGTSDNCVGGTLDVTIDNNDKFVAVKKGTGEGVFYFYNMAAGKFLGKDGTNASLTDATPESSWTIKTGGTSDSYPMMMDAQDGNHFNFGGWGQITVDDWSTADDGNSLEIMDYGEADEELMATIIATYTPQVSNSSSYHIYTVKSYRSGNYAYWTGDNTQIAQEGTVDVNAYWYLTEDGKLHNIATDKLYAGTSSFTKNGTTTYIKENPYNPTYFCVSLNSATL